MILIITLMLDTHLGVRAPCEQRVRAPQVKNGLISCSWLHLLKVWSLLKIRGYSVLDLDLIVLISKST